MRSNLHYAAMLFASVLLAYGDGLPLPVYQTASFAGSGNCALCHSGLTDSAGTDVSMDAAWRSTMMANSARDPLWQAKVASEVRRNPALQGVIEDKCATCHMPAARTQAAALAQPASVLGTGFLSPAHTLHAAALDGVSCTVCHQIAPTGLGQPESFSGHYVIDTRVASPDRRIHGPFPNPVTGPMRNNVGFTPVQGAQIRDSALCGTCHNLRTPFVDRTGAVRGEFPEQMVYSEWEASAYAREPDRRSCQDCHLPASHSGVILSNRGGAGLGLQPRTPIGLHHLVGGNTFMLRILGDHGTALGATASTADFAATRARTLEQLESRTATLAVEAATLDDATLAFSLRVRNLAGHKLPSGFPSRRAWLHVEVRDANGAGLYSSGAPLDGGRIAGDDADASSSACEPHHTIITQPDQVQIYEAVMEDTEGEVTHTLLRAAAYRKDNRLLPLGVRTATAPADIAPAGTVRADQDFGDGTDLVAYRISTAGYAAPFSVSARLLYQTLGSSFAADLLRDNTTPEVGRFAELHASADKGPEVLSEVRHLVPAGGDATAASRLVNLSSRARVAPGEAAIAGFTVGGDTPRAVLLRAVGPTLATPPFSLGGTLADPRLALYRNGQLVVTGSSIEEAVEPEMLLSAARSVGAFPLDPAGRDSVLLARLTPGGYTAVVTSASSGSGIVLIEVYAVDAAAGVIFPNLSTRATSAPGEALLIGGFVIGGETHRRLLLRGVGPGLSAFGVADTLPSTVLTVHRSGELIATNRSWLAGAEAGAIEEAARATGAFPLVGGDSALLLDLPPGAYTAHLAGGAGESGVGLVEIYELR